MPLIYDQKPRARQVIITPSLDVEVSEERNLTRQEVTRAQDRRRSDFLPIEEWKISVNHRRLRFWPRSGKHLWAGSGPRDA
ncbi:hypothetical protein GDO81_018475 [Engystomops pustulosus]|uniref:Uncharacterized protein n=1 Tax=Engystomops pustulosus TaxID=76066 RepID=A0AAV6ZP15_ENGPU|nr:hypothetical protein GDO81_018475 [Engystomops pustulosus]